MVWWFIILCLCNILSTIESLEVIPSKHEVLYENPKYIRNLRVEIKRLGRRSPYYTNVYFETLTTFGDNLTLGFECFENLQGHYVPLLFKMEHELCKFMNEPIIGRMLVEQFPKNLSTCPVPQGYYAIPKLQAHLENLPLKLPFTFDAVDVRGRVDIKAYITKTKEPLVNLSIHGHSIQKPTNTKIG